ncbi:hypothetical protein P872_08135 [Rhodonellum psychrophilum GCM71 = DSM 17998]|uniref:Uncharacterized protein n=1 Tax=Rhodonellum psychrophilum GCM71 = DSM 17998 TaxID=1123057 RepID=U5BX36_9BACT|nr:MULTISPECIES: hypothetical protein [Rhodonellum]ERM82129.1 hypothetical protein P872_08135 [Rhodonellum psychrophilum GCM71 = DSM 17998]
MPFPPKVPAFYILKNAKNQLDQVMADLLSFTSKVSLFALRFLDGLEILIFETR